MFKLCTTLHVAKDVKLAVYPTPTKLANGTVPLIICPPGAILILPATGDEK